MRHKFVGWVVVSALVAAAGAAQAGDIEGSKDHPLLTRYPGSVISKYEVFEFDEFTLPLGRLKDDGTLAKSQHLEGKITHIVYDAPNGRSLLEVYRNYESALIKGGFQVLYGCNGADACGCCGPKLYAPVGDEDWNWRAGERYISAKLSRPGGDAYLSLFIGQWSDLTQGPSIRLYVIEVKPMEGGLVTVNAEALAGDIRQTGHSAVYGIYFDTGKADVKPESDATIQEIAKLLKQDAALKLLVVGHTDNVGTLASNMDLSKRRAAAVVDVLVSKNGIAAARLVAQGAGPLAPVASNKTEEGRAKNRRVELVEQ